MTGGRGGSGAEVSVNRNISRESGKPRRKYFLYLCQCGLINNLCSIHRIF